MKILSLAKYNDLHAVFGGKTSALVSEVITEFEERDKGEMSNRFASSGKAGAFYVLTSNKAPGKIVEHVMGLAGDSVSCMYEPHPIFNTPADLMRAREDLIEQLESAHNAAPGSLKMMDEGRRRVVFLQEMAFAQIHDLVQRELLRRGGSAKV